MWHTSCKPHSESRDANRPCSASPSRRTGTKSEGDLLDDLNGASASELGLTVMFVFTVYLAVVLYVRVTGLRSLSKMSASDFAMTVAVGSLLASAADPARSLPIALVGLATLFVGQWGLARMRTRWERTQEILDNDPVLLVADGKILETNMRQANVAHSDLYAKLREANVLEMRQVRAVVFETTGDISVLHSEDDDVRLDAILLEGVRGADLVRAASDGR